MYFGQQFVANSGICKFMNKKFANVVQRVVVVNIKYCFVNTLYFQMIVFLFSHRLFTSIVVNPADNILLLLLLNVYSKIQFAF